MMTMRDSQVYTLKMELFHIHAAQAQARTNLANSFRHLDELSENEEALIRQLMELGVSPEEVLWDP